MPIVRNPLGCWYDSSTIEIVHKPHSTTGERLLRTDRATWLYEPEPPVDDKSSVRPMSNEIAYETIIEWLGFDKGFFIICKLPELLAVHANKPHYEVIVGNIGTVYSGNDKAEADRAYAHYVEQSNSRLGRAGGEHVTMMVGNEIEKEHVITDIEW